MLEEEEEEKEDEVSPADMAGPPSPSFSTDSFSLLAVASSCPAGL